MTTATLRPVQHTHLWTAAQWTGVVLTGLLLASLVAAPELSLHVLWDMAIPVLPAVFIVNPLLWRNVCPLATLNGLTGDRLGRLNLAPGHASIGWLAGLVLLAVMVPARRVAFNVDGPVLAVTIVGVALLAIGAGWIFRRHAGFCNAICPVLPVERLYGQAPLLESGNARCATCSVCTPIGCVELAGAKALAQALGRTLRGRAWLVTPTGAFAAAFPGFIAGYFTTTNGTLDGAGAVYAHVAYWSAVSYATTVALVWILGVASEGALLMLGATSAGLYYWFASPPLAAAYGVGEAAPIVRGVMLAVIALWVWRARGRVILRVPRSWTGIRTRNLAP